MRIAYVFVNLLKDCLWSRTNTQPIPFHHTNLDEPNMALGQGLCVTITLYNITLLVLKKTYNSLLLEKKFLKLALATYPISRLYVYYRHIIYNKNVF